MRSSLCSQRCLRSSSLSPSGPLCPSVVEEIAHVGCIPPGFERICPSPRSDQPVQLLEDDLRVPSIPVCVCVRACIVLMCMSMVCA